MKKDQTSVFSFLSTRSSYLRAACLILLIMLANTISTVAQTNSLVIAVEDDAAPWSRADGTGYANDVVVAAFKAVGVDVELRVVPYARCKRMAERGTAAGCFSMSPAPEFNGVIELSAKPLFTPYAGYFYNVNKPPQATRQEELPAKTVVGTVIGYEYPPEFERLVQAGIIVLEESPSEAMNLKKLAAGRVDLALLTYDEMKSPEWLMMRAGVLGRVKTTFRAGTLNSYIGFSLKHPQGAWALQQFNKGFRLITGNGTLRRIRQAWRQKLAEEKPARTR
jgi:polar amino acid transport system substrate-binding protein